MIKNIRKCLIVCDLDGTLLNNNGKLSNETIKTIKKINSMGHIFCIATGRPYRASIEFYKQLNLNTIMINYNGSLISNPSNEKFTQINLAFSKKIVVDFFNNKEITNNIENALIEGQDGAFFLRKPTSPEQISSFLQHFHLDSNGVNNVFSKNLTNIKSDINSILVQVKNETKIDDLIYNIKSLTTTLIARNWSIPYAGTIIEINSIFSNKGNAIKFLSSYYGISLDSCYAFGDGDNDGEMLKSAHYGYAMKNASMTAKLMARHMTMSTNEDNGVAKELKRIFKI